MSEELDRLRADLDALNRVLGLFYLDGGSKACHEKINQIRDRIAKLEAEAADPWRKAKDIINTWCDRSCLEYDLNLVANFVGHLEDTISELKEQNANLQSIIDEFGQYNE